MKYLIYKISGGLNHMLLQINNAIKLSRISNRFLIIDCKAGAFDSDFSSYFEIDDFNYSTNYDIIYDEMKENLVEIEPYIKGHTDYINGQYFLLDKLVSINSQNVIESKEKIVFCTYIFNLTSDWYIHIKEDLYNQIISQDLINYIGVHYRNTDMKHDLTKIINNIKEFERLSNTIYLATDDYTAYEKMKAQLSNFNIIRKSIPYNNNGMNIHYGNPNKKEVILNTLIDMFYLTYADYFVPSISSSLSRNVNNFRVNDIFFKKIKNKK